MNRAALVLGGVVGVYGIITLNWFLVMVGIGGVGWYFHSKAQVDKSKRQVHKHFESLRDGMPKILKAVLAEVVDWRKDFATADAQAEDFRKYLQSITTDQHLLTSFESGRAVMLNTAEPQYRVQTSRSDGTPLEVGLPDWDLLPPAVLVRRRKHLVT